MGLRVGDGIGGGCGAWSPWTIGVNPGTGGPLTPGHLEDVVRSPRLTFKIPKLKRVKTRTRGIQKVGGWGWERGGGVVVAHPDMFRSNPYTALILRSRCVDRDPNIQLNELEIFYVCMYVFYFGKFRLLFIHFPFWGKFWLNFLCYF